MFTGTPPKVLVANAAGLLATQHDGSYDPASLPEFFYERNQLQHLAGHQRQAAIFAGAMGLSRFEIGKTRARSRSKGIQAIHGGADFGGPRSTGLFGQSVVLFYT
jgi:hypothetical protein